MDIENQMATFATEIEESLFLRIIPLNQLRFCCLMLRQVRRDSLEYHQLRESIDRGGILQPILVRPHSGGYEVIDGSHRFSAASDLRLPGVPCMIRDLTDTQVLRIQIEANEVRCPSSMIDLSNRLHKIVKIDREMNVNQLAHSLSRPPSWVRAVLGLVRLSSQSRGALESGSITLETAIELSKLPPGEQVLGSAEEVRSLVRRMRSKRCNAPEIAGEEEGAPPAFRTYKEVVQERRQGVHAGAVLICSEAVTAIDGWNAAISWVLQMDKKTLRKRVDSMKG